MEFAYYGNFLRFLIMKFGYYSYIKFLITNKKVDELIRNKQFFFILSAGRSGTKFLANLLNLCPTAFVAHEPVRNDVKSYRQAFYNENKSYKYINHFRKKEIYYRIRKKKIKIYGEVNGVLNRHYKALEKSFSNSNTKFFHLVRDGRDVVRSIMSRKSFADDGYKGAYTGITPKNGDPYKNKWIKMSKFEKICWYWNTENKYLDKNISNRLNFEQIISDYSYLKEKLLNPLGLELSEKIWEDEIKKPKNITIEYKIPHWKEWTKRRTYTFNNICDETMKKLGY